MTGRHKHEPIKADERGRLMVVSKAASDVWGDGPERASVLAFAMHLIEKGWLGSVWDTLAQTTESADAVVSLDGASRPEGSATAQLTKADRLAITRAALSKLAELRPQDAAMVDVVLAQLPQQKRLKAARRGDPTLRAEVREKILADPRISLGVLVQKFSRRGISKTSLWEIQRAVRDELGIR